MNQPRLTIVVLPNKTKNPDLVLRRDGWMVCAFASWQTLMRIMEQDTEDYRVSISVAEKIEAPRGL